MTFLVAVTTKGEVMHEPIAYTYDADYHCSACAEKRFGVADDGYIAGQDADGNFPQDFEGNEPGVIAPWDEWWDVGEELPQVLTCGDCFEEIARVDE